MHAPNHETPVNSFIRNEVNHIPGTQRNGEYSPKTSLLPQADLPDSFTVRPLPESSLKQVPGLVVLCIHCWHSLNAGSVWQCCHCPTQRVDVMKPRMVA